jgi:hypothetical protein
MSRRVSDDRLGAIHLQLSDAIRKRPGKVWLSLDGKSVVEGHDLIALLDELRRRRQQAGRKGAFKYGKVTQALMAMKVGDVIILPPTTQSALTTSRATARKALGIPDARWHCEAQPGGHVRCERRPDGSDHIYGRPRNPAIAALAAMRVGEKIVFDGKMYAALKIQARKEMGSPAAQWRSENLANGKTRATRVA